MLFQIFKLIYIHIIHGPFYKDRQNVLQEKYNIICVDILVTLYNYPLI